jgi:hypothetical protein
MSHQARARAGNRHRLPSREHRHHRVPRPLPDPTRHCLAIDAASAEPFELLLEADGQIRGVVPLSTAGRSLMPEQSRVAWARKRGWWVEPQTKNRSNYPPMAGHRKDTMR